MDVSWLNGLGLQKLDYFIGEVEAVSERLFNAGFGFKLCLGNPSAHWFVDLSSKMNLTLLFQFIFIINCVIVNNIKENVQEKEIPFFLPFF